MIDIQHGDCVALMSQLASGSIKTIFADPPYNTGNKKDKTVKYDQNKDFERKQWRNFMPSGIRSITTTHGRYGGCARRIV